MPGLSDYAGVPPPPPGDPPPPPPGEPPAKRLKTEGGAAATLPQASGLAADDQVAAALRKLGTHIGNPRKFCKASELLRQLLGGTTLRKQHGELLFQVLRTSMRDPQQAQQPQLMREYQKLFTAASKISELFTQREKSMLDVWGLWAVDRAALHTDDSFAFNRTLTRLKAMLAALPEATPEDEGLADEAMPQQAREEDEAAAAATVREATEAAQAAAKQEPAPASDPAATARETSPAAGDGSGAGTPANLEGASGGEAVEEDPFGLNTLLPPAPQPQPPQPRLVQQPAPPPEPKLPSRWSGREVVAMRREALLDCAETAREAYRNAWARTSVDLLIEEIQKQRDKFCASHQPRIAELWRFVQQQRAIRRQGPSAREQRRDTTAFEAARTHWAGATLSARGNVGNEGDHKAEAWLG